VLLLATLLDAFCTFASVTAFLLRTALAVNAGATNGSAGTGCLLSGSALTLVAASTVLLTVATLLAALATAVAWLAAVRLAASWLTTVNMIVTTKADTNKGGNR